MPSQNLEAFVTMNFLYSKIFVANKNIPIVGNPCKLQDDPRDDIELELETLFIRSAGLGGKHVSNTSRPVSIGILFMRFRSLLKNKMK